MATKNVRKYYEKLFNGDVKQFMDCGKSIPANYEAMGKARELINIMLRFPVGYKVSYADLVNKKWASWNKENPSFKTSDVLSATDVKNAIRGFWISVKRGEIKDERNRNKMLQFAWDEQEQELLLEVVNFHEIFTVSEPKEKEKSEPKGKGLVDKLKALLEDCTSDAETKAIQSAIFALGQKAELVKVSA